MNNHYNQEQFGERIQEKEEGVQRGREQQSWFKTKDGTSDPQRTWNSSSNYREFDNYNCDTILLYRLKFV